MADRQKISSLTGQVEYDVAGNQKVSAVNAQVEYDIPGNQLVSHISAQVEYDGDKWQNNASLTNRYLADTSDLLIDHTFNAHNLTASASAPTADSGDKKEGISSAVYAKASSQYHYITDANLKSGFPLKNGDTVKQGTWTCWVKFNTLTGSQTLIAKENYQTAAKRTLQLDMVTSTLTAYWFYNTSNGYSTISIASGFVTGRWYHIAISFDGVNKYLNYRIWDDTAGSVVSAGSFDSGSFGGALNISDGVLSLGAAYDPAARANYLDGKLNAVHVFNRMLGWKEIDAIRSGTWTKQEDYMGLDVSQVQAQVEYDTFQAQRVYQVQAQVEVDDVVSYTSQLLAQVEYEETPNIFTSQLIVQVEYSPGCNFTASIGAGFSSNSDADILSERLLVGAVASSVSTSEPIFAILGESSYSNIGGTGHRATYIIVNTDTSLSGILEGLLDGETGGGNLYWNSGEAITGKYIKFDLGSNVVIDEAKWYQASGTQTHGDWKWQGSTNNSDWTDIGSSFTLGGALQTQTELNGNTTEYRYYRLLGVSGTSSYQPTLTEIEFKIKIAPLPTYLCTEGVGDRRSFVTVTSETGTVYGTISNLVNGGWTTDIYFNGGSIIDKWFKFDFGVNNSFVIIESIFSQTGTQTHGDWKWQGSNDNNGWTDIGASFTLGGTSIQRQTQLSGNINSYRYYRLYGVSGNSNASPYLREFTFKIGISSSEPEGSIVWGQITGVVENIHSFASSWTGTGEVVNTGDGEEIELEDGEYMECSPVNTGTQRIEIIKDGY